MKNTHAHPKTSYPIRGIFTTDYYFLTHFLGSLSYF